MKVVAKVTISNSNFENWSEFFNGYKDKRSEFVQNEVVEIFGVFLRYSGQGSHIHQYVAFGVEQYHFFVWPSHR